LEAPQYRWLVTQAQRRHQSLSQVLRELIDQQQARPVRQRREDPLFRLIGLGADRARDVAEHHDRYLYGSPKRPTA
jgi:hypothetical protein